MEGDRAMVVRGLKLGPPIPHTRKSVVVEPFRGKLLSPRFPKMPREGMLPSPPTVVPLESGSVAVTLRLALVHWLVGVYDYCPNHYLSAMLPPWGSVCLVWHIMRAICQFSERDQDLLCDVS